MWIFIIIKYYSKLQNGGTESQGMPDFQKVNKYHMEAKKALCHKK